MTRETYEDVVMGVFAWGALLMCWLSPWYERWAEYRKSGCWHEYKLEDNGVRYTCPKCQDHKFIDFY